MGQPVKLSDELVDDARSVAPFSQRSIAGQIEFWASLGKALEPLLRGDRSLSLRMAGGERPLSQLFSETDTAVGRQRVEAALSQRPYPHYRPVAGRPGLLRRIEEDARLGSAANSRDTSPEDVERRRAIVDAIASRAPDKASAAMSDTLNSFYRANLYGLD